MRVKKKTQNRGKVLISYQIHQSKIQLVIEEECIEKKKCQSSWSRRRCVIPGALAQGSRASGSL
jgi:hypothetical protein